MTPVEVAEGDGPVILGLPHTGTWLPDEVARPPQRRPAARSPTPTGTSTGSTTGLLPGATTVRATFHRYLIDANRGPDDASLYPGQNTTGLVPGHRLRRPRRSGSDGAEPDAAEIAARTAALPRPLPRGARGRDRAGAGRGTASRSSTTATRSAARIPFLFDGHAARLQHRHQQRRQPAPRRSRPCVMHIVRGAAGRTWVLNGRFKGGWTTRHYGRPDGVHAIQMELAQSHLPRRRGAALGLATPNAPTACACHLGDILETLAARRRRPRGGPAMTDRTASNTRDVFPPTGTEITAKSWLTEAPMRMLMNNLHPDVAENPHELVVYGGIGRAARTWEDFDRIVATPEDARGRRDAAGPVRQAGRRLPHPHRRAARADRQLEPGAALGDLGPFQRARSQGPDDVRPDDRRVLDLHRLAGHRAGHLRDLRRGRPQALRRQPQGPLDPDRRPRRHGRRPAAGRGHGRRLLPRRRVQPRLDRLPPAHPLRRRAAPTASTRRWR